MSDNTEIPVAAATGAKADKYKEKTKEETAMFTSHTKIRRWLAALLVLAMMIGILPASATTVYATDTPTSQIPGTVTVEKIRPEGITINLFDYWLDAQDNTDDSNPEDYKNLGINAGHTLKFGKGMDTLRPREADNPNENKAAIEIALEEGRINAWTNGARPMAGIVASTLGDDGYPVLNENLQSESLGYLFNTSSGDSKAAYLDVGGLLQQDSEGYFYYNSQENFAEFNETTNNVTLYNQEGVDAAGASPDGQFFPFNTAEEVFVDSEVYSTDEVINHYFGMHMTTSFQQTPGGKSLSGDNKPVTFSFSGDDDVWVYIDDVLVADLGGIHDACSVEINFSTGKIYVFKDEEGGSRREGYYDEGETLYNANSNGEAPTLKEMYEEAEKAGSVEWDKAEATFADESYHTFDFFYLERGNTDSNMRMQHNIQTVPESELLKIDQDGEPVAGAKYALYETSGDYVVADGAAPIATGTTDEDGVFTFKNTDGETLPLNDLKAEGHYLLREETVPERYRSGTEPIELYVQTASNDNKKLLLSANAWDTGAYAMPMVRVSATTDGKGDIQGENNEDYNATEGLIVAAIFKGENVEYGQTSPNDLNLVYGDPVNGWETATGDSAAEQLQAVAASKEPGIYAFSLDSSGAYSADIEYLPGDINAYSWMVNDQEKGTAQFMGAYFFVEGAESIDDIATAKESKIHLLSSTGFIRDFSMRLYAPNIENRLLVQKVAAGTTETLDGVTFELYAKNDVAVDQDGNYTQLPETPLDVATSPTNGQTGTVNVDESATVQGALAFYGIPEGEYYLVETQGTADYNINKTAIPVVVDESGVHVNAGDADDNVAVRLGVGKLVKSMVQFAVDDGIDATLHDINAELQSAENYDGTNTNWTSENPANSLQLSYSQDADILEYGPTTEGDPVTLSYDSGWGRLNIKQNLNADADGTPSPEPKQKLKQDQSLNNLFSGTTMVVVANQPIDPDEPTTDPDEPTTDPDEPTTDPDEPTTDPDEPTTDPDEPTTDPDEPTTDPDEPTTDPDEPTDPDNPDPDTPSLNKDDHFLYIEGYPEDYRTGEESWDESVWPVKPQGNITRAEVATIFYRLLKDEVREEIETDVNSFPDVNEDDWFNVTVSSLANMGAISGYEDGTFRPNEPISRAELAAMAVRFYDTFEAEYEEGTFLDVDGDEWYADAIAAAEELGILGGYPDGTVRPNNNITRAETCAIVNRVLERRPHDEHLGDVEDMRTWPDNQPGAWYYADMQEATNGHYYEWIDIDGSKFEEWTEVDKDYDWTKR